MMKLELMMRVFELPEKPTEEDEELKEKKRIDRLINGALDDEEKENPFVNMKVIYKPYVIDLEDVGTYGEDDVEHTKIITSQVVFYAKVPYDIFNRIYQASLAIQVKTLDDFKMVKGKTK